MHSYEMEQENQILSMIESQNEDNFVYSVEEQKNKIKELKQEINEKYPQCHINESDIKQNVYLLSFPLEIHTGILITIFEIQIDFDQKKIDVHAYFTNKHGLLIVHQKLLRLSVSRYMLRLNNNLRVGSFFLNPVYGQIGFNLQCYSNASFFQPNDEFSGFFAYLDSLIVTATHSLRFHFMRILFMLNLINIKLFRIYENYMDNIRYQDDIKYQNFINWRKFPKDAEQLLQRIKMVIKNNMHLEFNNQEYEQYGPILQKQVTTDSRCLIQIEPVNYNDLEVDQNFLISEGGFCNIYSKDIFYHLYKDGAKQQQTQKRPLVIKTDKAQNGDKVKKEIDIALKLSGPPNFEPKDQNEIRLKYFKIFGCCPYIAQFYYVPQRNDILLMERYYHSSLDYFKAKQQEVLSLSTRIFIAHSIAMGLRYIHNYGIIHMDIKSANILISKTLMAKITDFGEAIIKKKYTDKEKPGKTLPFCAPEIQQKLEPHEYTYAYDIYSFGVLLFELLFDRYPIDFRRQNLKTLEEKLKNRTYYVRYDENFDKFSGPQVIMKYLGRMCLQCLQPEPANRPNIDKIVLVLKDCLTYLDKVY
ncbi:unnamed protein product [Paramecium pentaurelia]|uniref:Protein kinase domain-containing protein n=1 Tax=Paramecium pentaurelia TaxID=43138 RepID=A0A8S1UJX3_9CILI|nr:unnamed protein product [Paramecium pentaurelia]